MSTIKKASILAGLVCLFCVMAIVLKTYVTHMSVARKVKNDQESLRYSSRDKLLQAKINKSLNRFDRHQPIIIDANLMKASLYRSLEVCWLAAEPVVVSCQIRTDGGQFVNLELPQSVNVDSAKSLFYRHEFYIGDEIRKGGNSEITGVCLIGSEGEALTEAFPVRVLKPEKEHQGQSEQMNDSQ